MTYHLISSSPKIYSAVSSGSTALNFLKQSIILPFVSGSLSAVAFVAIFKDILGLNAWFIDSIVMERVSSSTGFKSENHMSFMACSTVNLSFLSFFKSHFTRILGY